MIAPDRDRLELSHLIENSEYRQRLMLMEELLEAVRDAGPFPKYDGMDCCHCQYTQPTHAPDCPGIRVRDALAAIEARVEREDGARCGR